MESTPDKKAVKKVTPKSKKKTPPAVAKNLKPGKKTHQGEGGGRPSKKNLLDLSMIETFYSFGLIDEQICKALDITVKTLENWKKDEKFVQALRKGKQIADSRVERALYDRAIGYSHLEDDIRVISNQIVTTPIIKHYPPDTTAMIFWLKNRKRAEWRDKIDVDHDVSGNLADLMRQHLAGKIEAGK